MIKKFLWKNKIAISACVLTIAFGIGYWVLSQPPATSIGDDISVGNDLYVAGKVGVGTTTPATKLQIIGPITIGDIVDTCGSASCPYGTIAYSDSNHEFWGCTHSGWEQLSL